MPRDGSNIYTQPFPDVVEGTTIESAVYNGYVADVSTDLNTPRPIVAGGTGANNAHDAMIALQGEIAQQVVSNFDSYPWASGSFSSGTGATGAPVNGHAFSGIVYVTDSSNMVIEARDATDGVLYVRRKVANVWGAWSGGATLGGDLTISKSNPSIILNKAANTENIVIRGQLIGKDRWVIAPGDFTSETGSNAGSNFAIFRYDDAGAFIGTAFNITRSTGLATFSNDVMIGASALPALRFGSDAKYLYYDGTNFSLQGGKLITGSDIIVNSGNVQLGATAGTLFFGSSGSKYLNYDGTNYVLNGGQFIVQSNGIFTGSVNSYAGVYMYNSSGSVNSTWDGSNIRFSHGVYLPAGSQNMFVGGDSYAGYANAASGTFRFGNNATRYLTCDGSNYTFGGGGSVNMSGPCRPEQVISYSHQGMTVGSYTNAGGAYLAVLAQGNPNWANVGVQAVHYPSVWAGCRIDAGGLQFDFRGDANAYKNGGATTWQIVSDERIKDVTGPYTSGLDAVAALQPVRYTLKGNESYSPPSRTKLGEEEDESASKEALVAPYPNSGNYIMATENTEYIGLVAQQAEQSMPELVNKSKGFIDGIEVDDLCHLDTTPLFFALINAVKELKARVEALEAA
jgi:hypothetical protein